VVLNHGDGLGHDAWADTEGALDHSLFTNRVARQVEAVIRYNEARQRGI
ncbi:MAG: hypothetical protein HRT62_19325, partial [Epibacterium sp.]|nr:hypothetical protein [Epibacterium sp.]